MLNIISKSYCSRFITGPKKVVDNLIKGLEELEYPYVVNRRLDACRKLWIHDDIDALRRLKSLSAEIKTVVGPNLFVVPRQIPANVDLSRTIYLHPSRWVVDFWKADGFAACPMEAWPAGIDMDEFTPGTAAKTQIVIYFKQRDQAELELIKQELERRKLKYQVIVYPKYSQKEYKQVLGQARYVIWLGRQESQGIALLEALCSAVPIIVCDVLRLGHWQASAKEMAVFNEAENNFAGATAAEYFDQSCGIKIKRLSELPDAINRMEKDLGSFKPREYILNNLNLKKQARELLGIYHKYFGLTFEAGLNEKVLADGDWQNNNLYHRGYFALKDLAKQLKFKIGL